MKKAPIKSGKGQQDTSKPYKSASAEKYVRQFIILDEPGVPVVSDTDFGYMLEGITWVFLGKCLQAKEAVDALPGVPPLFIITNDLALCQLWAKFLVEGYLCSGLDSRDFGIE